MHAAHSTAATTCTDSTASAATHPAKISKQTLQQILSTLPFCTLATHLMQPVAPTYNCCPKPQASAASPCMEHLDRQTLDWLTLCHMSITLAAAITGHCWHILQCSQHKQTSTKAAAVQQFHFLLTWAMCLLKHGGLAHPCMMVQVQCHTIAVPCDHNTSHTCHHNALLCTPMLLYLAMSWGQGGRKVQHKGKSLILMFVKRMNCLEAAMLLLTPTVVILLRCASHVCNCPWPAAVCCATAPNCNYPRIAWPIDALLAQH